MHPNPESGTLIEAAACIDILLRDEGLSSFDAPTARHLIQMLPALPPIVYGNMRIHHPMYIMPGHYSVGKYDIEHDAGVMYISRRDDALAGQAVGSHFRLSYDRLTDTPLSLERRRARLVTLPLLGTVGSTTRWEKWKKPYDDAGNDDCAATVQDARPPAPPRESGGFPRAEGIVRTFSYIAGTTLLLAGMIHNDSADTSCACAAQNTCASRALPACTPDEAAAQESRHQKARKQIIGSLGYVFGGAAIGLMPLVIDQVRRRKLKTPQT